MLTLLHFVFDIPSVVQSPKHRFPISPPIIYPVVPSPYAMVPGVNHVVAARCPLQYGFGLPSHHPRPVKDEDVKRSNNWDA